MNNDQVTNLLTIILVVMLGVLFLLVVVYLILKMKDRNRKHDNKKMQKAQQQVSQANQVAYNKQSVFSFMRFDKIQDDMIVRQNGTKFIMVIECQGINYDLMSGIEKTSVEQGFIQFLNTLRHPIQIYTQTRTVNLGGSIEKYKDRLKEIENRLVAKQLDYNAKVNSDEYSQAEINKARMEVVRERNLYEYGRDIINNTERMNLNKNILRRHYYIVISYVPEEINNQSYGKDEIRDRAFNELYTKCQSAIASLSVCGINGKILNSNELAELLYMAYNRDDADMYQLDKALDARYDELYITAQDVLDKKMKELDKKIQEDAIRKANEKLLEVAEETEKQRSVREKEENIDQLINEMAKIMIDENKDFVGDEAARKAKEKIDEEDQRKGGKKDEKKQKTTSRGRKKIEQ